MLQSKTLFFPSFLTPFASFSSDATTVRHSSPRTPRCVPRKSQSKHPRLIILIVCYFFVVVLINYLRVIKHRRASRRWARLTEKEKKPWHDLAEQEKIAHKEAFPEYRYCPKRHSSASSLSSFSSSSLASPSSTAAGNNNALMFAADTDGDAQSAADGQLRGDTSGHRYKKARRRTK